MRLFKLGIYHSKYLSDFYAKRPELKAEPYFVQHKALIDDGFGSSDFWTSALNKLNYETVDIIANAEFLQKKWASEARLKFNDNNWLFEITTGQIKDFCPDILLVADYSTITADFLRNIRRECPSIRLILGWCSAPYTDSTVFHEWDIALSCVPEMVADFRAKGLSSYHVNHAFASRILEKIDLNTEPNVDFAFIGSVLKLSQFHIERERLLLDLIGSTDLQIWSVLENPNFKERQNIFVRRKAYNAIDIVRQAGVPEKVLMTLPLVRKVARWKSPPNLNQYIDERIRQRTHPPLFGIEMFQQLRESRIVFNNHINISPVSASNMRLFETTGVGTCLITDWKENISDLFEPEKEILTYRSAEECAEKVGYLLKHKDEREKIAAAGHRRTLRDHTFESRAGRIDEIIRRALTST